MTMAMIAASVDALNEARVGARPIAQLTNAFEFDLPTAYRVQSLGIRTRLETGEHVVGVKLGLTSRAKMEQVGVSEVILGQLTSSMTVGAGETLDLGRFIHPRAEPEVAFRAGRAIGADEPVKSAARAFDAVAPAVEVIDSRYADFRFTLEDVVADNASSAAFVVGAWTPYDDPDRIANLATLLEIDGDVVQSGSTAAILGHPARALPAAIALCRRYGIALPAGTVLLAGAATEAVAIKPGQFVRATVAKLGDASFTAAPGGQ